MLPLLWDAAVAVFFATLLSFIVDKYFIHAPTLLSVAKIIESRFAIAPRWISLALELQSTDVRGSKQLINETLQQARQCLRRYPALPSLRISRWIVVLFAVLFVWSCTTALVRPRCSAFWDLPLGLGEKEPARIVPGSLTLPMHASVNLRCIPRVKHYPSCRIVITDLENGSTQRRLLRPDSSGGFSMKREGLTRSFAYKFAIGASDFPPDTIRLSPQPSIEGMRILVNPPAYTGRAPELLAEGQGNFSAYAGSAAHITLSAPVALARARFCPVFGDIVAFKVKGRQASAEVRVLRSSGYTFSLVDTFGQKNDSLPSFYIDLIADKPPYVHFLKPAMNKELTTALAETLWIEAVDDIGIKECSFHWRKNTESKDSLHSRDLMSVRVAQPLLRREMAWDLSGLSLYPGDTVFYWASARDNNPFNPSRFGVSDTFWMRLPSFEEINTRIVDGQNDAEKSMHSVRKREEKLQSALDDLAQSARGEKSMTWEQKRILSDLKAGLKEQSDTLAKAIESLKRTVDRLKEQGLSNRDLIDKMDKVKKALEDIARDYGDSLLFEPPRKDESMNVDELKAALDSFKKMLPDLAKRLDVALKYLEMLKRDQRLAQLAKRAETYAKRQLDLAAKPEEAYGQKQQKELTKNIEDLLSDLNKKNEDGEEQAMSQDELPSLKAAQSRLAELKNRLSENSMPGREAMERMGADLFSLAQNLRDLQSSAMMVKMKKEQEALLELSHDALSMGAWQNENAANAVRQSLRKREKSAQAQQALKQALLKSEEKLNTLSITAPQTIRRLMELYDRAAASMDKSLNALKNEMDGADEMGAGEQDLNALANSLIDASGSLDGGQDGNALGEMMGGFQRLSGKQSMINGATGSILRNMLGDKSGEEAGGSGRQAQGEKARREAQAAQKAIADELQKLAETYGKKAGNGMEAKAKDLEEEARRLSKMLDNPQPEIQDRQQRFLSRMLQTTLSMHKQDEGKDERQSQSAKNMFTSELGTPGRGLFNDRDSFFQIRQKAFSGNFPESYRGAIKNYFDSLGSVFLKDK
jgi:predicted RNA-binding protein with EMAP domain